jgi:hypothetical protein
MTRAIEEGAATETVDPAAVYKILDRKKPAYPVVT